MVRNRYVPLVCLGILATMFCNSSPAQQPRRPGGDPFKQWDSNGDGKLTRDELPAAIRGNFDRADTNRDGAISREEHAAPRNRRPGQPARPQVSDSIRAELDVPYSAPDNPRQKLDLYLPKNRKADEPLPVVVWIHGGACRGGDKRSGGRMLADLVGSGNYAGVSVGYRLTGEAIWPVQIHDCKAAVRWIRANAKRLNLDADRIGVWGSSAGGHLVAMLGTSGDVKNLEGTLGKQTDQGSRVTCVVDYFGPSDLLTMGKYPSRMDHDAADSPESLLVGGPVQKTKDAALSASPTTYVSKDDPPFLIVHGDKDPLVPHNQSVRLGQLLRKAKVDVTLITVTGGGHGGFRSGELLRRVHAFLDKHLRDKDAKISAEAIPQGEPAGQRSN